MEIKEIQLDGNRAYHLSNEHLSVVVTALGAGIFSLEYYGTKMTLTHRNIKDFLFDTGYHGKTVGRIAGRLEKGVFAYGGHSYQIGQNEGPNTLHGGAKGFSFREFEGKIANDELALTYHSKDGEEGFPGDVLFTVKYKLEGDSLLVKFLSTPSIDTPLNFTNHSYFNLGEASIEHTIMRIASGKTETYTVDLIPLGLKESPACLDFRKGKEIGKDIDDPLLHETRTNGYDHCFYLDEKKEGEAPIALIGKHFQMEIETSLPAIQIYSSNYFDGEADASNGEKFKQHDSVAMEPVYVPNDFDSMMDFAHKTKEDYIRYSFKRRD